MAVHCQSPNLFATPLCSHLLSCIPSNLSSHLFLSRHFSSTCLVTIFFLLLLLFSLYFLSFFTLSLFSTISRVLDVRERVHDVPVELVLLVMVIVIPCTSHSSLSAPTAMKSTTSPTMRRVEVGC
ncbi:hypothetical protein NMG60_11033827 [Bertholletia excelsa]